MEKTKSIYSVADKHDKNRVYNWYRPIDRKTENNNALAKMTPLFMSELQKKFPEIISGELLLRKFAELSGFVVNDEYFHYSNDDFKPALASDDSDKLTAYIEAFNKALKDAEKKDVYPTAKEVESQINKIPENDDLKAKLLKKFCPSLVKTKSVEISFS